MSSAITGTLYDLPVLVKCLVLSAALLVISAAIRLITNRLPSQSPPVFEGIPFIGGVFKFVQARVALWPCFVADMRKLLKKAECQRDALCDRARSNFLSKGTSSMEKCSQSLCSTRRLPS